MYNTIGGDFMRNELGKLLESVRKEKKLSLREAASLTGLGHSYIRDLELGINRKTGKKVVPSINSLQKIANAYHLDTYELLIKAGLIDIDELKPAKEAAAASLPKSIPVLRSIGSVSENSRDIQDHVYFPLQINQQPDFAFKMRGDSLIGAGINDGDIIFFRNSNQPEFNGQIVAVRLTTEEEGSVKRISWSSQFPSYCLMPDNKNYRTVYASFHDVEIYGVYYGHFKPEKV